MKKYGLLSVLSLLIASLNMPLLGAKANSAQHSFTGTYSSGVIVSDEDSPVIVSHEDLHFNITSFPNMYDDNANYDNYVRATYTFENPSDFNVNARLVFPFGKQPHYISDEDYAQASTHYEVKINDAPVASTIRHTYSDTSEFDIDIDLARLKDSVQADDFFNNELEIHRYSLMITTTDSDYDGQSRFYAKIRIPHAIEGMILFSGYSSYQSGVNSDTIGMYVSNYENIIIYTLGDSFTSIDEAFTLYSNYNQDETYTGGATLMNQTSVDLEDLLLTYYEAEIVSEVDYKNAVIDYLNLTITRHNNRFNPISALNVNDRLLCWYDYEMAIAAGQTMINEVQAPLFPHVRTDYEPPIYNFEYLLTPASTWADFSNLDISITTPFYMTYANIQGFTQTTTGYELSLDELPTEDLKFQLSTGSNPEYRKVGLIGVIAILAGIGAVVGLYVGGIYLLGGIALLIYFIVRANRKKTH